MQRERKNALSWGKGSLHLMRVILPAVLGLAATACMPFFGSSPDDGTVGETSLTAVQGGASAKQSLKANILPAGPFSQNGPAYMTEPDAGAMNESPGGRSPALFAATATAEAEQDLPEPVIGQPSEVLQKFYGALQAVKNGRRQTPVTILHLGDDHVAADEFTGELRKQMQSRFGSSGRGMMTPGVFPTSGFKVERGGQWSLHSSAAGHPGSYSLSGVRLSAATADAWVRLTSLQGDFDWIDVTFATGPGHGSAVISLDGEPRIVPTATPVQDRTSIAITLKARELLIKPRGDGQITLLSVALGTHGQGVRYVSLGLPGATAMTMGKWNSRFVASDIQRLQPDLVVLNYGIREGFLDDLNIEDYELRIRFLIEQFRQLAPQASLLIIGPPDAARLPAYAGVNGSQLCRSLTAQETAGYKRALRKNDPRLERWHAPPKLDQVRMAQKRVAAIHGAYFWDWAKMMGGPCSIHAWASAPQKLAAADRVALTAAGAERSARALFLELMNGYDTYLRTMPVAAAANPAPAPQAAKIRKKQ
jgi:hypothetical protein